MWSWCGIVKLKYFSMWEYIIQVLIKLQLWLPTLSLQHVFYLASSTVFQTSLTPNKAKSTEISPRGKLFLIKNCINIYKRESAWVLQIPCIVIRQVLRYFGAPFMVRALILYCCEVVVGYRGKINMTSLNSALYILRRYKLQCILCFFHSNSVNLVKIRCLLHLFFFVLEG